MHSDFLLHLDTLGTQSDAAIIGLGGMFFNLRDPNVQPVSKFWPIAAGSNRCRTIDPATIEYWQSGASYLDPFTREDTTLLELALHELVEFYLAQLNGHEMRVWTWTARIEGTILQTAFEAHDMTCPWPYYAVWEGKTFCRICEEYVSSNTMPTPSGLSPEDQMKRRVEALRAAHRCFTTLPEEAAA